MVSVMIDYFSRKVRLAACDTANGENVAKGLEGWLRTRETIGEIVKDGGKVFANNKVKAWLEKRQIGHDCTLSNGHRSNGLTERLNCTVVSSKERPVGTDGYPMVGHDKYSRGSNKSGVSQSS